MLFEDREEREDRGLGAGEGSCPGRGPLPKTAVLVPADVSAWHQNKDFIPVSFHDISCLTLKIHV